MELNLNSESKSEEISQTTDLASLVASSQEAIAGTRPKRKYTRRQDRSIALNAEVPIIPQASPDTADTPFIRQSAGLKPYVHIALCLPLQTMAQKFGNPVIEPDAESLDKLAIEGDELLGGFFPGAKDNKWVALSAFSGSVAMMYFSIYKQHESARAERLKKQDEETFKNKTPDFNNPIPVSLV